MPVIKELFTRICFMLTVQIIFYIIWSLLRKLAVYDIKKLFILLHTYCQLFSKKKKKAHRLLPAGKHMCASSSLFDSFFNSLFMFV